MKTILVYLISAVLFKYTHCLYVDGNNNYNERAVFMDSLTSRDLDSDQPKAQIVKRQATVMVEVPIQFLKTEHHLRKCEIKRVDEYNNNWQCFENAQQGEVCYLSKNIMCNQTWQEDSFGRSFSSCKCKMINSQDSLTSRDLDSDQPEAKSLCAQEAQTIHGSIKQI